LSDKDEIKELFQRELGNYEAKVDPSIWSGIQSGLSSTTAAAASSMSLIAKITIAAATSAVIGIGAYFIFNDQPTSTEKELTKEKEIVEEKNSEEITETAKQSISKMDSVTSNETIPFTDSNPNDHLVVERNKNTDVSDSDSLVGERVEDKNLSFKDNTIDQSDNIAAENLSAEPTSEDNKGSNESSQLQLEDEKTVLALQPFIERQENQRIKFGIEQKNISAVYWDFGDGNISKNFSPEHFYDRSGEYVVKVIGMNGNNEIRKTLTVKVEVEGEILNLPNVFTPNRDGQNDYFFIESKGLVDFQITIMNTRQEVVFQSNDPSFKWNGLLRDGTFAPNGNYVYIVIASDKAGNTINKYQRLSISRN
jgi:gliding motility-associated-like protein